MWAGDVAFTQDPIRRKQVAVKLYVQSNEHVKLNHNGLHIQTHSKSLPSLPLCERWKKRCSDHLISLFFFLLLMCNKDLFIFSISLGATRCYWNRMRLSCHFITLLYAHQFLLDAGWRYVKAHWRPIKLKIISPFVAVWIRCVRDIDSAKYAEWQQLFLVRFVYGACHVRVHIFSAHLHPPSVWVWQGRFMSRVIRYVSNGIFRFMSLIFHYASHQLS